MSLPGQTGIFVPDKKNILWQKMDWDFIGIPLTDYSVKPLYYKFDFAANKWILLFKVALDSDIDTSGGFQEAGISVGAVIIALAVIGFSALIFFKGEAVIYLPSIAIIAGVSLYYYKELRGFLT